MTHKKFPMTCNLLDELRYWEIYNGAPVFREAVDEIEALIDAVERAFREGYQFCDYPERWENEWKNSDSRRELARNAPASD